MSDQQPRISLSRKVKQSPPVDFTKDYDVAWVKDKHIIITGGASGFGEGFARIWAAAGASIVISDINVQQGDQTARIIRKETGNERVHFIACDVRDWEQQVHLFKEAVRLSPHGGIDVVVPNAGISGNEPLHESLVADGKKLVKPDFRVMDVNFYGVLYTVQLALHWLPKNPNSQHCSPDTNPAINRRDRCILLIGSVASLLPFPKHPLYNASKHGVLGLFRSLRSSVFIDGVRINMLCPYFTETPMINTFSRVMMAGTTLSKPEDVIDTGTRLVADSSINGRALAIGPRVKFAKHGENEEEWVVVPNDDPCGTGPQACWEVYAEDFEHTELIMQRLVGILNTLETMKGWLGFFKDILAALRYGIFG